FDDVMFELCLGKQKTDRVDLYKSTTSINILPEPVIEFLVIAVRSIIIIHHDTCIDPVGEAITENGTGTKQESIVVKSKGDTTAGKKVFFSESLLLLPLFFILFFFPLRPQGGGCKQRHQDY